MGQISVVLKMRVTCLFLVVALAVLCLSQAGAVPAKRGSQGECHSKVSNCIKCAADNDRQCIQCKAGAEIVSVGKDDLGYNKCKYTKDKVKKRDRKCCCDQYGNCTKNGDLITGMINYVDGKGNKCDFNREAACLENGV